MRGRGARPTRHANRGRKVDSQARLGVVVLSKSFLVHVASLGLCERQLDSCGDVACDLVEVSCASSGGGCSASWVCPAEEAPTIGSVVRVSVEVVA